MFQNAKFRRKYGEVKFFEKSRGQNFLLSGFFS